MKARNLLLTLAGFSLILPLASVQAEDGCRIKEEKLERKLAIARAANNVWQAEGLEKALAEVRRNCSPDRLKSKRELKIQDKERKVKEREMELEEAIKKGDKKKIAKMEQKLHEAKAELEETKDGFDAPER